MSMPGAVPVDAQTGLWDGLYIEIWNARRTQLEARIAWARSANTDTIRAEKAATREVDVLLDRLLLRRRASVHQ